MAFHDMSVDMTSVPSAFIEDDDTDNSYVEPFTTPIVWNNVKAGTQYHTAVQLLMTKFLITRYRTLGDVIYMGHVYVKPSDYQPPHYKLQQRVHQLIQPHLRSTKLLFLHVIFQEINNGPGYMSLLVVDQKGGFEYFAPFDEVTFQRDVKPIMCSVIMQTIYEEIQSNMSVKDHFCSNTKRRGGLYDIIAHIKQINTDYNVLILYFILLRIQPTAGFRSLKKTVTPDDFKKSQELYMTLASLIQTSIKANCPVHLPYFTDTALTKSILADGSILDCLSSRTEDLFNSSNIDGQRKSLQSFLRRSTVTIASTDESDTWKSFEPIDPSAALPVFLL